jgi:hypothetical protein
MFLLQAFQCTRRAKITIETVVTFWWKSAVEQQMNADFGDRK